MPVPPVAGYGSKTYPVILSAQPSANNLISSGWKWLDEKEQLRLGVYERILNDPLIGRIFNHYLIFSNDRLKDFAYQIVASQYPEYGNVVIRRRVSTILSWCEEILSFVNFS